MFFSIIVPVYNVEKYLCECIDSILTQSFTDYELILVDDGSPDNCPAMCDSFASDDKRVKVIHKENGGLSDARNAGIKAAVGQYVMFVDSDDYIEEGSLGRIAETVLHGESKDIVFLNALCLYPDGRAAVYGARFTKSDFKNKSKAEILKYLTTLPQFHVSACVKLVKREVINANSLFFTKGLLCEDVDWSVKLYLCAESFGCCEYLHYYNRQEREGSIMYKFSEKRYADIFFIITKWIEASKGKYREYKDIIRLFMSHQYFALVLMYGNNGMQNRSAYKKGLNEYSWLLGFSGSKKALILRAFDKVFGIKMLSFALNIYSKMRIAYE